MNGAAVRNIVIVGGGSAGWMAAAAAATTLRGRQVTVVESEEIGIIGVGEAAFPSIRAFNRLLQIDEADFLRATRGTYKLGIQFRDWSRPGQDYFHTFGEFFPLEGSMTLWGQYRRHAEALGCDFGELNMATLMAMQGRFAVPQVPEGQEAPFNYAYHFDAQLYAAFLRRLAESRGARRVEGRIVEVLRRADGGVARLRLADGRVVEGDFFFDCSGFASLLVGKTLGVPFVDESHWLPVDRAWAVPVQRQPGPLLPYTRATALEGGWSWRIPLQDRTGYGHVFASRFIDERRAREQLLQQVDGPVLAEPRLLRFATGYRQTDWLNNVVAVGLAGGFLEPLESTAIYLVQATLGRVMPLLDRPEAPGAEAVEGFNHVQLRQYQRIRDFIVLHYCLSERRDSALWRHVAAMELPESLAYKLHAWRELGMLPVYDHEGFDANSWLSIHAGMGHWPQRTTPWLDEVPPAFALDYLRRRRAAIAEVVQRVPLHDAFLRRAVG
jgi:glycine/D-amino acid oxidase-like deaminating enzyme